MLKAMFHFDSTSETTLGFTSTEQLIYLGKHPDDKNWLRASNSNGFVGYVPATYVQIDKDYDSEFLLKTIDAATRRSQQRGDITVVELIRLRNRLLNSPRSITEQVVELENEIKRARHAAMSELNNTSTSYGTQAQNGNDNQGPSVSLSPTVSEGESEEATDGTNCTIKTNESEGDRPLTPVDEFACEMIDEVRNATGISHAKAQVAVHTVVHMIQREYGGLPLSLAHSLEMPSPISKCQAIIERSVDAQKLRHLFKILTACKDDEQQRSWAVHEDDKMIQEAVADLNSILMCCDYSVSTFVMKENHYSSVHSLALFFQMETRKEIRAGLTEVFLSICKIDPGALRVLSNSILPMELAREFKDCTGDENRLLTVARLLTFLMSTGEALPITHYELLGTEFILTVLKTIEESPDPESDLPNELTNFILAYNLQFYDPTLNFTVQALSEIRVVRYFSQNLINLLNWGRDPIAKLPHKFPLDHCLESNSVFKLLTDMFSSQSAAKLFYLNDLQVLMDVLTRWVTDLSPGEDNRRFYLTLIGHIIRNTAYLELQHRREDLAEFFTKILHEEDPESTGCQKIVNSLLSEFPILKMKRGKRTSEYASESSSTKRNRSSSPEVSLSLLLESLCGMKLPFQALAKQFLFM